MDVEKIVREYIDKSLHLSLATVSGEKPWVSELHFAYDNQLNLYFRSLKSRRHCQEIALNPNVAGNIVKQHLIDEYPHAIYFEGTAQLIDDNDQIDQIFPYFKSRLGVGDEGLAEAKSDEGHKIYKISVETWYAFGKFGGDSGQKYQLPWNGGNK